MPKWDSQTYEDTVESGTVLVVDWGDASSPTLHSYYHLLNPDGSRGRALGESEMDERKIKFCVVCETEFAAERMALNTARPL